MKPIIIMVLLLIVGSLGKALASMTAGPENSARVVQALTWRIGLSVGLFIVVFASYHFGWISPNSLH